jgi:4-hydroxy-tetrahydrodipicolinate reductase
LISSAREEAGRTQSLIPGVGQTARGEVVAGVPIHSLRINGVSAKQEVNLGGKDELLTICHTAGSVNAYSVGILESLRFTANASGITLGLNKVLGI